MKNRSAWGVVLVMTIVVLGGAVLLLFQVVSANHRQKALIDASQEGDVAVVRALLDQGVSVKARDKGGSAFDYAIKSGNTDVVSAFLAHGVDVNTPDPGDSAATTPLAMAVSSRQPAVVKLFLAQGANPNVRGNIIGDTPLMGAAGAGPIEIVQMLIAHGADVNAKNDFGVTSLMLAVSGRRPAVVKLLLAHGANVNAKEYENGRPNTALTMARESLKDTRQKGMLDYAVDYAVIVRLLQQARAKQ